MISLKKIDEFDRDGNLGAWVRQIARRLIANERRKEARRSHILSDHVTDLLLELDEAKVSCALVQHENEEELTLLRDCLSKLLSGDSNSDPPPTCTNPHSQHAFMLSVFGALSCLFFRFPFRLARGFLEVGIRQSRSDQAAFPLFT